jgi:hypothetical protein
MASTFLVLDPVGDQVDAVIGAVVGDRGAVAIDDPAAPGRGERQVDAIAFGQQPVALILEDDSQVIRPASTSATPPCSAPSTSARREKL